MSSVNSVMTKSNTGLIFRYSAVPFLKREKKIVIRPDTLRRRFNREDVLTEYKYLLDDIFYQLPRNERITPVRFELRT